jgi:hypothetical protein
MMQAVPPFLAQHDQKQGGANEFATRSVFEMVAGDQV